MTLSTRAAVVAILATAAASALAGPSRRSVEGEQRTAGFHWHDGDRRRPLWLDPAVVADLDAASDAVPRTFPGARRAAPPRGGVALWRLDDADAPGAVARLRRAHPRGRFSEVLRDGPTAAAAPRALPGNVVVQLDPRWDSARVEAWLARRKLEVVARLGMPNTVVVRAPPGLEALALANALFESGEVVAASPDWWRERAAR